LPVLVDEVELFNSTLEILPNKGPVPKLLVQADYLVLAYLEDFKVKESKKIQLSQDILSFSISRIIFSSWLQSIKEKARIQINPKLF